MKGVDLSHSLIPSWDVIALIAIELPSLERLALKYVFVLARSVCFHFHLISNNRLRPPSDWKLVTDAFSRLTELQLNGTLMDWQSVMNVITLMPRLNQLESGYNRLRALTSLTSKHPVLTVTTINLDCNQLSCWAEVLQALSPFQKCSHYHR